MSNRVNVKVEVKGLEDEVFCTHRHDDGSFAFELEQPRYQPFKIVVSYPKGTQEFEVFPG